MDRFSPFAPACIRVQVLPVSIDGRPLLDFLSRLQKEACIVNLADIDRYVEGNDLLLSPKGSPKGRILYSYSTSAPSPQEEQLSPFELFREPLIVLGVVDGQQDQDGVGQKELGANVLRERYPRVVYRQLLVLEDGNAQSSQAEDGAIRIPNASVEDDEALREALCRITARFLQELSTYTRAMQASPSVQTPGQTARKLQRTSSQRDQEKRPSSGHSTPTRSVDLDSPADSSGGSRPPPLDRSSPATSFDQISGASNSASNISRSDSRASNKGKHARASSQDRVAVQGFGSGTSQDKLKQRGKARVGIVIGTIYMAAGQWSEALRLLNEHTNKARILSDHIWHAKGLENIVVCLLLHSWAGMEFQIPSVCYLMAEKSSSRDRSSVSLPSDLKIGDTAQGASVRRLSTSLPDLFKLVLSLYRSVEGSLELPRICIAEATVRFSKLLAMLHTYGGELEPSTLDSLLGSTEQPDSSRAKPSALGSSSVFSKASIAEMLASAHPNSEDTQQSSEQIIVLAGMASVYNLLEMKRKRANALKDLVAKLTNALTQVRRRGSAESGIPPAAGLSAEAGRDASRSFAMDSEGINSMMTEIAQVYGAQIPSQPDERSEALELNHGFGSNELKLTILNQLIAFCEASPDPYGVVRMTTGLLSTFGVHGAVDVEAQRYNGVLSKDHEARLTTNLARSVAMSKHLGLLTAEAVYWDRCLVRDVQFVLPDLNSRIIEKKTAKSRPGTAVDASSGAGGNPLLYDPNANRPGTADTPRATAILIAEEPSTCLITLQNPNEISVEVESLTLIAGDLELKTSHPNFSLQPMRLQQIPLTVFPAIVGDYKIENVRVKISGCVEEAFPIVSKAWTPEKPTLIKNIGQDVVGAGELEESSPERAIIPLKVVEAQPLMALERPALQQSSMMLLDGEKYPMSIVVRNTSTTPLSIFDIVKTQTLKERPSSNFEKGALVLTESVLDNEGATIAAGQMQEFEFVLDGKADVSRILLSFMYSGLAESQYARTLDISTDLTVNAALQAQHFTAKAIREHDESFTLSFDLRNAWPRPMDYRIALIAPSKEQDDNQGTLHPGQIVRVYQAMPHLNLDSAVASSAEGLATILRERLSVQWSCEGRVGEVDLSGLALSSEEADVVAKPSISIRLALLSASRTPESFFGDGAQVVKVGSFVSLLAKIATASSTGEPLFLQLHIHPQSSFESDPTLRPGVMVNGASHRILRPSNEATEVEFSLCAVMSEVVELEVTATAVMSGRKSPPIARRSLRMMVVS